MRNSKAINYLYSSLFAQASIYIDTLGASIVLEIAHAARCRCGAKEAGFASLPLSFYISRNFCRKGAVLFAGGGGGGGYVVCHWRGPNQADGLHFCSPFAYNFLFCWFYWDIMSPLGSFSSLHFLLPLFSSFASFLHCRTRLKSFILSFYFQKKKQANISHPCATH